MCRSSEVAGGPTFAWFSISQSEQTVADAVVVARDNGVELVVAETEPTVSAPSAVHCYRLTETSDQDPDGAHYFFKKMSATSYPANANLTVESVLEKEMSSKSKK